MQLANMISLIKNYDVPIIFFDQTVRNEDPCSAIIIAPKELAEIRGQNSENVIDRPVGVYALRCDTNYLYQDFLVRNAPAVYEREKMIQSNFGITFHEKENAFSLFTILHEIGHIIHIRKSGLSNSDYWFRYNASRDDVQMLYQFCNAKICQNDRQRRSLLTFVNQIYANIPAEKFANEFANNEFMENWELLKRNNMI